MKLEALQAARWDEATTIQRLAAVWSTDMHFNRAQGTHADAHF